MKFSEEQRKRLEEMRRNAANLSNQHARPTPGVIREVLKNTQSNQAATNQQNPLRSGAAASVMTVVSYIDNLPIKSPPYTSAFYGKISRALIIPLIIGVLVGFVVVQIQSSEEKAWATYAGSTLTAEINTASYSLANAKKAEAATRSTIAKNQFEVRYGVGTNNLAAQLDRKSVV